MKQTNDPTSATFKCCTKTTNPASNIEFDCFGCGENLLRTCAMLGSSAFLWYPAQSFFMLSSNQPSAAVAVRGIELEP